MPEATISVVMVSYHTGDCLWPAIESVLAQQGLDRLVLVDNGNPADVTRALQEKDLAEPRLTLISGQGNVGFSRACNSGAAEVQSDYICLLNPDCQLQDANTLQILVAACQTQPDIWMAGPLLLNPDGSEQRGGRRNLLTPATALGTILPLPGLPRLNLHHTPLPDASSPVPAISGACMLMPMARYHQLGGMDESYFLHVEDLDLCMRVHKKGGKIWFVPHARVLHQRGSSDASGVTIERHKAAGMRRYFRLHYAGVIGWTMGIALTVGIMLRTLSSQITSRQS